MISPAMTLTSLDFTVLPRDALDPRYILSFSGDNIEAIREFFGEYGFVVIHNVFDDETCAKTVHGMWEVCEGLNPGLHRDDISTWNALKASGKYGLSSRGPCFHPQLVRNRQNPILIGVLELLIGSPVLVSQDRFAIYRSTVLGGDQMSTGPRNLHLDMNPWWWLESSEDVAKGVEAIKYDSEQDFIKENNLVVASMGTHIQCVLNFTDNLEEDGGTIVVPKFHRYIEQWSGDNLSLRKPLPWLSLDLDTPLLAYAQRIPMRQGSVLMWNQTVFHGTSPNQSSRCRTAQYLKAFPSSCVSDDRGARRSSAIRKVLDKYSLWSEVTPLGEQVFGIKG